MQARGPQVQGQPWLQLDIISTKPSQATKKKNKRSSQSTEETNYVKYPTRLSAITYKHR